MLQGDVYRQIIEKIVQAAKNDFEEGGYAPDTLTDLKTVSTVFGDACISSISMFLSQPVHSPFQSR